MGVLSGVTDAYNKNIAGPADNVVGGADEGFNQALGDAQDTVRDVAQAPYGTDMDREEFAEYSVEKGNQYNELIATPGEEFGKATDDTIVDNTLTRGAVGGGEGFYDFFVAPVAQSTYSTVTGSYVKTGNPNEAAARTEAAGETGYDPGLIDALEFIPGYSGAKNVAKGSGKAAAKHSDDLARAADNVASVLPGIGKRTADDAAEAAAKSSDDAAEAAAKKATDPGVSPEAGVLRGLLPDGSTAKQTLKAPAQFGATAAARSVDEVNSLTTKFVGGGLLTGVGLEALGIDLNLSGNVPSGWSVDKKYEATKNAGRIKVEYDGNVIGYHVVVGQNGPDEWLLLTNSPTQGNGTKTVDPDEDTPKPTFQSSGAADRAYESWVEAQANDATPAPSYRPGTDQSRDYDWGEVSLVKRLDYGWFLGKQQREEDNATRFVVAAERKGTPIYITEDGAVSSNPETYSSQGEAEQAYNKWQTAFERGENVGTPGANPRPDRTAVFEDLRSSGSSGGGILGAIPVSGAAILGGAILAYYIIKEVL